MKNQTGITIILLNTSKDTFIVDSVKEYLQNITENYEIILLDEKLQLKEAILKATKEWTLIFDNNGILDIKDFNLFWEIKDKYDFILGFAEYQNRIQKIINIIANHFLPTESYVKDIYLGFKLFKTFQLKQLKIISTSNNIYFEILYKLNKKSPYFKQIPLNIKPENYFPKLSIKEMLRTFKQAIKTILEK